MTGSLCSAAGFTGLITAHKLGDMGKEVVVLNRKKSFAEEMSSNDRYYLRERLTACGVILYKMVAVKSFTDDGVIFTSKGEPLTLEGFDTVVISEKHQPSGMRNIWKNRAGQNFT